MTGCNLDPLSTANAGRDKRHHIVDRLAIVRLVPVLMWIENKIALSAFGGASGLGAECFVPGPRPNRPRLICAGSRRSVRVGPIPIRCRSTCCSDDERPTSR